MKRQTIISLVVTFLILLIGAFVFRSLKAKKESTVSKNPPPKELRKVEVSQFPPSKTDNRIEIDGRVSAYEKINLSAEVQGKLIDTGKKHRQGSSFAKGDLLFKVESKDDEYALKAQRSLLFNAITQIMPDLKFDYPDAFDKWKQYLDAFDIERNVRALPEIGSDKEKYYVGGKNIYNQYYSIKSAEERLKNYNIYAPFNGVFLSVNSYPGSLVSPGGNLGQIMNTYNYELISPVAIEDLKYLKTGQKVTLHSEELNKDFAGTVSRTSKQLDPATQSIPVYINVSGSGLRDGMYLKGGILGAALDNVSIIPVDLLVNTNQIFTYQDSVLQLHSVSILKIDGDSAYVQGLDGTEQVITSGNNNLFSGQKVKL